MKIRIYTHHNGVLHKSRIYSKFKNNTLEEIENYIISERSKLISSDIDTKNKMRYARTRDYYRSFQFVIIDLEDGPNGKILSII